MEKRYVALPREKVEKTKKAIEEALGLLTEEIKEAERDVLKAKIAMLLYIVFVIGGWIVFLIKFT